MPDKLLSTWMTTMRAAVVALVVIWVLNIPGRLQIPLFTEQLLSTVLGLALALCFLTFPFVSKTTGEEAIVAEAEEEIAGVEAATDAVEEAILAEAADTDAEADAEAQEATRA